MQIEVVVPRVSETTKEVLLVEWLAREGDLVKRGQDLFTVESDKATVSIESPADGALAKILVPGGTEVAAFSIIGIIHEGD